MVAEAFVRLGRRDAARSWAEECAIKLVEACVSEDRLSPDPVYALAALDAASRLHPWRLCHTGTVTATAAAPPYREWAPTPVLERYVQCVWSGGGGGPGPSPCSPTGAWT